ncbi:MAG: nucleoside deaminase [Eubacteriaceae bacterium]|jgi:tRNA(adenine34) deaminase|nr:nucleoside deaminase [Eubacteriaceae bacterium]
MMNQFMDIALEQARRALVKGEVPVGAVIVRQGEVISQAHNEAQFSGDMRAHAEMRAIDEALGLLGKRRLAECEIYVTLEPCPMCAWAIRLSRIKRVIYGAADYEYGACGSVYNFSPSGEGVFTLGGIRERECADLLKEFFRTKRE